MELPVNQFKRAIASGKTPIGAWLSGIIGMNPDMAGKFIEYGFSWVAVGSDMGYMVSRGQEYLAKMRGSAPAAPITSQSAY